MKPKYRIYFRPTYTAIWSMKEFKPAGMYISFWVVDDIVSITQLTNKK